MIGGRLIQLLTATAVDIWPECWYMQSISAIAIGIWSDDSRKVDTYNF